MSSRIDWQSALIIGTLRGLAALPFTLLQILGFTLGSFIALLPLSFNRVARKNIELCFPDLSPVEQRRLAKKSVRNTIITAFEQAALWCAPAERLAPQITGSFDNENFLQSTLAKGKGIILLAPHISSWEISQGFVCGRYKFCAVYKPLRKKAMEAFILDSRKRAGMVLLPTTPSGLRKVYTALQDNQMVCILPDQVPGRNNGVFSSFFGQPAWTMTLVNKLARKTNASVVIGACYRRGIGKGFKLECLPVDAAIADEDPVVAANAMNRAIEEVVKRAPEQYHWIYKRFKMRPDGAKVYT
jgi:KDO2-lipid IV(A) lauroyltransferase